METRHLQRLRKREDAFKFTLTACLVAPVLLCPACGLLGTGGAGGDEAGGGEGLPIGPLVLSEPAVGAGPDGRGSGAASRDADLIDVDVDVDLDLEAGRISGRVRSTFEGLLGETRTLAVHAADMDVREILDGKGRALAHRLTAGDRIEVTLEDPLRPGEIATVDVRFSATPRRGWTSSIQSDGTAGPREAGRFAPEAFGTGDRGGLRTWLPLFDAPGELARFDVAVTVDDGMAVVSNGRLVEIAATEVPGSGAQVYRWATASPIPVRSFTLAAARLETYASKAGGTDLFFHLPAGTGPETAQRTFGESPAVFAYFGQRLGLDYPFPRYDQVVLERLDARMRDGASVTLVDADELAGEDAELDDRRERPRRAVARGIARSWFGGWITPLEEPHRWLLDGLGYLLEMDYEAHVRGQAEVALEWEFLRAREVRLSREGASFRGDPAAERERRAERAALCLRMIRGELGEETFWRLVKAFTSGERGRVVTVEDFRRLCIDRHGLDVGPIIARWSLPGAVPELQVRFQRRAVEGVGESIGVIVRQVHDGPPYDLHLPLVIHYDDGSTERRTMDLVGRRSLEIVPLDTRVVDIGVDPEGLLLAGLDVEKEVDSWLAQASPTRSPVEHLRLLPRLRELARTDRRAVQAMARLLLESTAPTLRESVPGYLDVPGPEPVLALMRASSDDPSPRVRQAATHGLLNAYAGGRWDPTDDELDRLRQLRNRELSPAAQGEIDELLELVGGGS